MLYHNHEMCLNPLRRQATNTQLPFCSDKYEVVRFLGSGSFCRVYLVRHKSLQQLQALKIYSRSLLPAASDLIEAQLLKSTTHPCIPRIYDLTQDTHNFYLFEEYIEGETLNDLLLHQPVISPEFLYAIMDKLCDTIAYLHGLDPVPVLYRDLKPEHILLCGDRMWLIDFGITAPAEKKGNNNDHLGNQSFSAPECHDQASITYASDVYSVGKILSFLTDHLDRRPSRPLRAIIHKATANDPSLRYETIEALSLAIKRAKKPNPQSHLHRSIAVVSSHPGCGATHLAFSLTSVMNYLGIPAVYYERNESDSLRSTAEWTGHWTEKEGCLHHHFFKGIPSYGPGISIPDPDSCIQIYDHGSNYHSIDFTSCDMILFLTAEASWKMAETARQLDILKKRGIPCRVICAMGTAAQARRLAGVLSTRVYRYPPDEKPFRISDRKVRFFLQLLK